MVIINCTNCGRMKINGVWGYPTMEEYCEVNSKDAIFRSYKQCPVCLAEREPKNCTLCGNPAVPHRNKGRSRGLLRSIAFATALSVPATPVLDMPKGFEYVGESEPIHVAPCIRDKKEMDCVASIGKDGTKYFTSFIGEKIYEIFKEVDGKIVQIYKNHCLKDICL